MAITALSLVVLGLGPFREVTPEADALVRVVTADPVRVELAASPTHGEISSGLRYELERAAGTEVNPALVEAMTSLAGNEGYLADLAGRAINEFENGNAGALAYAFYEVAVAADSLTITSVTAELLPRRPSMAVSIAHEDGHAYINDIIARRCGPLVAHELIEAGERGGSLRASVINTLLEIGDQAHDQYHLSVDDSRLGAHARAARVAADSVIAERCFAAS